MNSVILKTQPAVNEIYNSLKNGGSLVYGGGNITIAHNDGILNVFFGTTLELTSEFSMDKIVEAINYIHIFIIRANK